jgi:hypothetical protein
MVSDLKQIRLLVEQAMKKYNRSIVISNWLIGLAMGASLANSAIAWMCFLSN